MYEPTIPVMPIASAAAVVRDGSLVVVASVADLRVGESIAFSIALRAAPRSIVRPDFAGTTSIPPDTTLKVASLGGRFTERRMDASHASAAAPPMPTRVAPPLGRSSSWAIRHRASRNRVGPTFSATGAETAVRADAAASASRAAVTRGSSRTTGRRTGPCRSSDASASTSAAEARERSRRTPGRAAVVTMASPLRSRPASTAGRSTAAAILATV